VEGLEKVNAQSAATGSRGALPANDRSEAAVTGAIGRRGALMKGGTTAFFALAMDLSPAM
jgi:hypothetical protein